MIGVVRTAGASTLAAVVVAAVLTGAACGADDAPESSGTQSRAAAPVRTATPIATPAFRARVRHARVPGVGRIAWYQRGRGRPLLMSIGTGSTMAEWDPALLRLLAAQRRLILYDPIGIGRSSALSSKRAPRTSFARMANELASFMGTIGVRRADVLGWSMGGFVTQQLAIRHPRRVRRMVLAGTNPGGDLAVLGSPAAQAIDSAPDATDATVLKILYPTTPVGQAEGRRFLGRLDRASETGEIPDDFEVRAATVDAQVEAEDAWMRHNANAHGLEHVAAPTLATGGTIDPVVPPVNLRRVAGLVPGARLELFAGGAHAFLFQYRDRFARSVDRFLGR
jgi:pimeloyl-ACP methyl ester carboxylesterase